jgi:hypothetical protein
MNKREEREKRQRENWDKEKIRRFGERKNSG